MSHFVGLLLFFKSGYGLVMPTVAYTDHLMKFLRDWEYAVGYLDAARDEGNDVFELALRQVAAAQNVSASHVLDRFSSHPHRPSNSSTNM